MTTSRGQPIVDGAKLCTKCATVKQLSEFHSSPRHAGGVYCHCRPCVKALRSAYYATPEYKAISRARGATPEYKLADWARTLRRKYGIAPQDYEAMLATQGGGCALCNRNQSTAYSRFAVDHDHACCAGKANSCGKCLRAILCSNCNGNVGWMETLGIRNEYTETWRQRIAREIPNPWDEFRLGAA